MFYRLDFSEAFGGGGFFGKGVRCLLINHLTTGEKYQM